MKRLRKPKPRAKGRKVGYKVINTDTVYGRNLKLLVSDIVHDVGEHDDIREARFALAWCTSWTPDVEGIIPLAKIRKATDLDREFVEFDFCILLNQAWFLDPLRTDEERRAVLDHELCHAALVRDARTGEPSVDERGRKLYRLRKHEIEEFFGVIERHGLYKRNLELAYAAMRRNAVGGFTACETCRDDAAGGGWRTDANGAVQRCECWHAWQARLNGLTAPAAMAS